METSVQRRGFFYSTPSASVVLLQMVSDIEEKKRVGPHIPKVSDFTHQTVENDVQISDHIC